MTLLLVRHARAVDRDEWEIDDRRRPLDKKGRKQAKQLVEALASYDIDRLLSSPYDRCIETLEPLRRARGLEIEVRDELGEEHQLDAGAALIRSLLNESVAVCGHGGLSDVVAGAGQKKGETFVLGPGGRIEARFRV